MVDAILAATIVSGVPDPRLASGDRRSPRWPGLHHLDPGADGFIADLGVD